MLKQVLPIYAICNLNDHPGGDDELIAARFSDYLLAHQDLHFPHKHSFFHLVYFTKGSGTHSIDFVQYPVTPGQIYFMIPGQVHTWDFEKAPDGFIVNFSAHYLESLIADPRYTDRFSFFSGASNDQVLQLPASAQPVIKKVLENIVKENHLRSRLYKDLVRALLIELFILTERCVSKEESLPSTRRKQSLVREFQQLVEVHYKEKKLTKDYADMLHITPNHLNALCKRNSGIPAGEVIRERILLEAKRLLINAQMTIAEIALELNFADNSYFSRFFKKYAGVTPQTFRKQVLK
ncbi:helix-turn-helix domain-containing protein [Ferruginibacter sp. HRS2-29]|uniref:helix-turn-helix domain-containing protein n=1 Tax=Ferruginibacter sp. HRS2-29 TaxID=2487334 RepID=UPI0020CDC619|nr:helix-turn-helix domain-containing protein [Ferruginibacter sp. HRS2-29]MCP9750787.1 helix-turn-helix domain-containing protein [Ferruginibacter sp. HRS2-29]